MLRRQCALLLVPLLMAALVACGGGSKHAGPAAANRPAAPPSASAAAGTDCPTKNTKAFAKTRFVTDAGIAFGAFHRWIYKPYKAGSFKPGASGRTKALVKAGAAGLFAANRLNAARKLVDASPLLCKSIKAPLANLTSSLSGLAGKLKSGKSDDSEIDNVQKQVEGVRSDSGKAGASITDKNAPVPGT
jgi:hypothetical protein